MRHSSLTLTSCLAGLIFLVHINLFLFRSPERPGNWGGSGRGRDRNDRRGGYDDRERERRSRSRSPKRFRGESEGRNGDRPTISDERGPGRNRNFY